MIPAILFILLISLGIGLPLTLIIAPKHNVAGRLGLSYLLGIGIFTLLMYVTNLLGLKLTFLNNILIFIAVSIPLVFLARKKLINYWNEHRKSVKNFRPDLTEKIILFAIMFLVLSSFIATFYWPVYIWDSLTLYDFRAHLFSQTGFIKHALDASYNGYYLSYPLLTSLSHTIVYLTGGNNPQFIYSLFYMSLGLVFYGQLREFVSGKYSLLFTLVLILVPQIFNQSAVSYTNLPYMIFFALGAIYFYVWNKKRSTGYLMLSAILLGFSVWTRSVEPFWMGIFMLLILTSIFRKKFLDIFVFSFFFFPVQMVWENFKSLSTSAIPTTGIIRGSATILTKYFNFQKIGEVSNYVYQSVIHPWGLIFPLFLAVLIYSLIIGEIRNTYMIYLIVFVLLAMLFAGTYVFSFTFATWSQIPDSASRMAMIFYPLFMYSVALSFVDEHI